MTQTVPATAELGPGKTGLTIGYTVLTVAGGTYSSFTTTNVAETTVAGTYRVANGVIVPDAGGYLVFGVAGTAYAEVTVESVADTKAILEDTGTTLDDLVDDLETRLTATRAGYLDNLSAGAVALDSTVAKASTALSTATWTATRAGYLDNLSAGAAALETTAQAILADTGTDGVVVASASKTGYSLAATGLDSISTTAPTGVASNFREMVIQTWRRFFGKVGMTAAYLRTYADDGTTQITQQSVSDDGAEQIQGKAT